MALLSFFSDGTMVPTCRSSIDNAPTFRELWVASLTQVMNMLSPAKIFRDPRGIFGRKSAFFSKMVLQNGTQYTVSVYSDFPRTMKNRPPQSAVFKELRPVRIGTQDKNKSLQDRQIRFSSPPVKLFSKQPSFPLELKGKEIPGQRPREQSLRLLSLILLHFHRM